MMQILWAYAADTTVDRLIGLLVQAREWHDSASSFEDGDIKTMQVVGRGWEATIEELHGRIWPIEVTIRVDTANSEFQLAKDNLGFGEWIVDNLACTAVVDCHGRYNPPWSDRLVRITPAKLESIMVRDGSGSIDEVMTKLIALRSSAQRTLPPAATACVERSSALLRLPQSVLLLSLFGALLFGAVATTFAVAAVAISLRQGWEVALLFYVLAGFMGALSRYIWWDYRGKQDLRLVLGADAVALVPPAARSEQSRHASKPVEISPRRTFSALMHCAAKAAT